MVAACTTPPGTAPSVAREPTPVPVVVAPPAPGPAPPPSRPAAIGLGSALEIRQALEQAAQRRGDVTALVDPEVGFWEGASTPPSV
jgi:hypothetical protein